MGSINENGRIPSSATGHKGFDYWKDEFSSKIQEIEAAMHQDPEDDSARKTKKLIKQATKLLPNLLQETQSVSKRNDPALRQELLDIYQACRMQLETYQLLQEQQMRTMDKMPRSKDSISSSSSSSRQQSDAAASKSELWDHDTMEQRYNSHGASSLQRHQVQTNTRDKVSSQNTRLQDALRSLKESQEVASEITGELHSQRAILENTQNNMNSMKDMTQQAKGLLKSMNKKWWMKW
jgi:Snare region anchored in the vesicle membrane C-terminus